MKTDRTLRRRSFLTASTAMVGVRGLLGGTAATNTAGRPRGVHLSHTDDPATSATAAWFTDGLADPGTNLEYGSTPDLGQTATGSSRRTPFGDSLVHQATMTGLDPGQTVHYRVGGATGYSGTFQFRTAGRPDDGGFTFTMYGDQGVSPDAVAVNETTIGESPDLHLITGDTSYAEGDSRVWDAYFDQQQQLFATTPTMPVVGNHEYDAPGPGAAGFRSRFALPGNGYYYSFDYENVHFVGVDANGETITEGRAGEQLVWLETDLARARRARAGGDIDWIIAFQHQPLYSSEDTRRSNIARISALEPIYQRYGVDLVLAGHNHMYERSLPMAGGVPTNDQQRYTREQVGFLQVVNGGGGRGLYEFRPEYSFQAWSAEHALRHASTAFRVDEERIQAKAVDAHTGELLDEFVVMAGQT